MLWQGIARKSRFIRQVMDTKAENLQRSYAEEDTEELSPDQIMAAASGDMRILERVQLNEEIRQLRNAKTRHERNQQGFKATLKSADGRARDLERQIEDYKVAAQHQAEHGPDFHLKIGSTEFRDRGAGLDRFLADQGIKRKDFDSLPEDQKAEIAKRHEEAKHLYDGATALERARQEGGRSAYPQEVGTFRGLPIVLHNGWTHLKLPGGRLVSTGSSLRALESKASSFADLTAEHERLLDQHHQDMAAIREKADKPFAKVEELMRKQARLQAIEQEMANESKPKEDPSPVSEDPIRLSLQASLNAGRLVSAVMLGNYPELARKAAEIVRQRRRR